MNIANILKKVACPPYLHAPLLKSVLLVFLFSYSSTLARYEIRPYVLFICIRHRGMISFMASKVETKREKVEKYFHF